MDFAPLGRLGDYTTGMAKKLDLLDEQRDWS